MSFNNFVFLSIYRHFSFSLSQSLCLFFVSMVLGLGTDLTILRTYDSVHSPCLWVMVMHATEFPITVLAFQVTAQTPLWLGCIPFVMYELKYDETGNSRGFSAHTKSSDNVLRPTKGEGLLYRSTGRY